MDLTSYQIQSVINRLGFIQESNRPNHKGWVSILCPNPYHHDTNFGNCSVNIETGVVKCFACNYAKHLVNVVMELNNMQYKDACKFIEEGIGFGNYLPVQKE